MSLSLGNLLFFGELRDFVPIALGMALFTTMVVSVIAAVIILIIRHAGWSWRAHPEESLAHMSGFTTELEEDPEQVGPPQPPHADLPVA